jgi:hypothetical protein
VAVVVVAVGMVLPLTTVALAMMLMMGLVGMMGRKGLVWPM